MYAPYFGLQREPFSIAPDPRFLFMSDAHREALAHLLYGVSGGGGFVLLTGEIGAGKTTVCRCFLDQVPPHCDVAYVFNPKLSVAELLQTVCDEFGIALPAPASGTATTVKGYVDALNAHLLRSHAAGRHSVLIIDEAQSLSAELLEQLRLLTNLETAERKLLQIVLIGQPELRTLLARPDLEQLAQRVLARFHLPALRESETLQYVQHRLAVAGLAGQLPFDNAALRRMHQLCAGVPRRLNLLADRALLGAYASGRSRIDRAIVDRAAAEVFGRPAPKASSPWPLRRRWAAGITAAAGCVGIGVGLLQARVVQPRLAAAASATPPPAAAAPVSPRPSSGLATAAAPAPDAGTAGAVARAASTASTAPAALLAALKPAVATTTSAGALPPAVEPKPAAEAPAAPAPGGAGDAAALWSRALRTETAGFGELARLWQLAPTAGDPCQAAARLQVMCWRGSGGLGALRDLGRPAVLVLRDGQAQPRYAVLTGLADAQATLRTDAAGGTARLPLAALPGLWRGEFATLWRAPPGYAEPVTDGTDAALADWLDARLPGTPGQPLKSRLLAYQLAQGLKPDGLAGPLTLMHVNRSSGIAEPQLTTER